MARGSVFLIGPGFIGWNVLELLVAEGYRVTGFVRRQEHGEAIRKSGAADVIIGDLNDGETIAEQTIRHNIVIHTATADHIPSVEAVLEGIKQRAGLGQSTVFIHTSGTSVFHDNAMGEYKTDTIYYDNDRVKIDSVSDHAPHRQIDLAILGAQKQLGAKAKMAIMTPPLIYGFNPEHKRLTIQIPTLTRFALKHGFAPYIGKGLAVSSNIHVLDLARAYIVLLHHLEEIPAAETLSNPYYFAEITGDNEPSWLDIANIIGEGLQAAGRIDDPTPRSIDSSFFGDLFGDFTGAVAGLNCRSRAQRLRELGWEPREKDWRASFLDDELPALLQEETGGFDGYAGTVAS